MEFTIFDDLKPMGEDVYGVAQYLPFSIQSRLYPITHKPLRRAEAGNSECRETESGTAYAQGHVDALNLDLSNYSSRQ